MENVPAVGPQRERAVAQRMGYRTEHQYGYYDQRLGRLVHTHGQKDFKESEACLCEAALFWLTWKTGEDGQKTQAWEEVPHFSDPNDIRAAWTCIEWLCERGLAPGLRWRADLGQWECWVEAPGLSGEEQPRATSPHASDAITAALLRVPVDVLCPAEGRIVAEEP